MPCGDVAARKIRLVGNLTDSALLTDAPSASQDCSSVCCFLFVFSVVGVWKAGDGTSVTSGHEQAWLKFSLIMPTDFWLMSCLFVSRGYTCGAACACLGDNATDCLVYLFLCCQAFKLVLKLLALASVSRTISRDFLDLVLQHSSFFIDL